VFPKIKFRKPLTSTNKLLTSRSGKTDAKYAVSCPRFNPYSLEDLLQGKEKDVPSSNNSFSDIDLKFSQKTR
jgi:hypothetical protein